MTRLTAFALAGCSTMLLSAAFGQASEVNVTFQSQDGFALHGKYFSASKPGPGILLVHQCNRAGPATGLEPLLPALSEAGFHVLMYDSRGFGESRDERYSDYHAQMESIDQIIGLDIEAAYQFLTSQPGVDANRIGIVAASCGTWQAIPLSRKHSEIRALVFLSGTYLDLDEVEAAYEELVDRPILAVYSEEDRYGTPDSMQAAFRLSENTASKLIAYKGRLHGGPLLTHDAGLNKEIAMWLASRLLTN